jgi:hypothetical protein
MGRKPSIFASEVQARDGAIRGALGRLLRAQYDLAEPLPERLAALVKRFQSTDEIHSRNNPHRLPSLHGTGARLGLEEEPASP